MNCLHSLFSVMLRGAPLLYIALHKRTVASSWSDVVMRSTNEAIDGQVDELATEVSKTEVNSNNLTLLSFYFLYYTTIIQNYTTFLYKGLLLTWFDNFSFKHT